MDALHKLKQKLKSQIGASITFALLLFLVCAVVGSAVLVAGTAAAGRMSKVAEMDQRYYAVNSAAKLLVDLMERDEIRYQRKESVPVNQSTGEGESGEDTTGSSDDSEEEYEWFIKQGNDWTSLPESDSPLTLFLAKQALSMSKNMTEDISFQIKPDLTLEGVKLNVTAVGTMTKGDTDNSADLLFILSDATTADSTEGNYRIKAYFTNVGGDSFFHWKLYDMESIRKSTETAVSSGSDGEETP